MKQLLPILLLPVFIFIPLLQGMSSSKKKTDTRVKKPVIQIEEEPNLEIHEGYVSQKEETVLVKRGRKTIAKIHLSEPVMVAMAEQEERWGYFQFPSIGRTEEGFLVVEWQMQEDSYMSYGRNSERKYTPMMSKDNGKTWIPLDKSYNIYRRGNNVYLKNGGFLQVKSQQAKAIKDYKQFPKEEFNDGEYKYYLLDSLPNDLQGIYINYVDKNNRAKIIHSKLYDPGALRYSIDEQMPIVWWGNIKQLADSSLVAGVYPSLYKSEQGTLVKGGISFYTSNDSGESWSITGKIPYIPDNLAKQRGNGSYDEPAFEILPDSSFICIMRSGATSPLYRSYSKDKGITWSTPRPFTPNGVEPQLLQLASGVLVLSSGRPGVQLLFNFDKKGILWTASIDMIPFMNADGTYSRDVSCGYTSMIEDGIDSFMLVYSDFTKIDSKGRSRKSILCRKITVNTLK